MVWAPKDKRKLDLVGKYKQILLEYFTPFSLLSVALALQVWTQPPGSALCKFTFISFRHSISCCAHSHIVGRRIYRDDRHVVSE